MKTVALGEVAAIERRGVDPLSLPPETLYIGLEHIERGGQIIGHATVGGAGLTSTKFRFTPEHVLFGKLRPNLGKVCRPDFPGVCSTDIVPIRPSVRLDRDYLARYLSLQKMIDFAASRATGANLPRLSPAVLTTFPIPLPSLEEQRRIAGILDHADVIRAMRRQVLAQFDTLAQSIFHDMFDGRNDPTERLDSFVDADDRLNYGVVQPGDTIPDGVPLIRVSNLVGGIVDRTELKRISPLVENAYGRSRIRGTEILVSCVGSIGIVGMVAKSDVGSNVARAIARVPISNPATRAYVAAFLRTDGPQRYFMAELRTVAQPTLNVKQLAATVVPVPPVSLQQAFLARVEAMYDRRALARQLLDADNELFSSLQVQAFGGEL